MTIDVLRRSRPDGTGPAGASASQGLPTANDVDQDHDDCDDQQDVDEPPHGVGREQSQQPQDYQDRSDQVQHHRSSHHSVQRLSERKERTRLWGQ